MTAPTVDVSRMHAAALAGAVEAAVAAMQTGGRWRVYVGEVTTSEADVVYPYLVVWPSPATRPTNLMSGSDGAAATLTQLTCAATSADEVLAGLDRVCEALHRRRLDVPGRTVAQVTQQQPTGAPPQPQRDPTVRTADGRPVFFSTALFSLYSTPDAATWTPPVVPPTPVAAPVLAIGLLGADNDRFRVYAQQDVGTGAVTLLATTPFGVRGATLHTTIDGVDAADYVPPDTAWEKPLPQGVDITAVRLEPDPA